jgi:hypothetical protein
MRAVSPRSGAGFALALAITVPPDERVERDICVLFPADVRRFLLAQPGTGEARPSGAWARPASAQTGPTATLAWFLLRAAGYFGVALAVFAFVTWLLSR